MRESSLSYMLLINLIVLFISMNVDMFATDEIDQCMVVLIPNVV